MSMQPTTDDRGEVPPVRDPTTRLFVLFGLALWLVATVAFRFGGQYVLDPGPAAGLLPMYVVTGAAMTGLALLLYRWRDVTGSARQRAAIALALPGMLLDSIALAWFEVLFPNLAPEAASFFGGLLLWAYAAVLLSGFVPGRG